MNPFMSRTEEEGYPYFSVLESFEPSPDLLEGIKIGESGPTRQNDPSIPLKPMMLWTTSDFGILNQFARLFPETIEHILTLPWAEEPYKADNYKLQLLRTAEKSLCIRELEKWNNELFNAETTGAHKLPPARGTSMMESSRTGPDCLEIDTKSSEVSCFKSWNSFNQKRNVQTQRRYKTAYLDLQQECFAKPWVCWPDGEAEFDYIDFNPTCGTNNEAHYGMAPLIGPINTVVPGEGYNYTSGSQNWDCGLWEYAPYFPANACYSYVPGTQPGNPGDQSVVLEDYSYFQDSLPSPCDFFTELDLSLEQTVSTDTELLKTFSGTDKETPTVDDAELCLNFGSDSVALPEPIGSRNYSFSDQKHETSIKFARLPLEQFRSAPPGLPPPVKPRNFLLERERYNVPAAPNLITVLPSTSKLDSELTNILTVPPGLNNNLEDLSDSLSLSTSSESSDESNEYHHGHGQFGTGPIIEIRGHFPPKGSVREFLCVFCKGNNEPKAIYQSHPIRVNGQIICPFLSKHQCQICKECGHTIKYCPKNKRGFFAMKALEKATNAEIVAEAFRNMGSSKEALPNPCQVPRVNFSDILSSVRKSRGAKSFLRNKHRANSDGRLPNEVVGGPGKKTTHSPDKYKHFGQQEHQTGSKFRNRC